MSLWESGQSLFTCIARFCSVLFGFAFVPSFIWFCLWFLLFLIFLSFGFSLFTDFNHDRSNV